MATIRRKYTLVELLIVCAIILVLVGIGSGGYALVQTKIKESRTTSLLKRIETALENTKAKHGFYPPSNDSTDPTKPKTKGTYLAIVRNMNVSTNPNDPMNTGVLAFAATDAGKKLSLPVDFCNDLKKSVDFESLQKNAQFLNDDGTKTIYVILDAYGYPIYYRCPGLINRNSFDLMSCGKDGQVGDTGKDLWQGQPFTLNTSLNGSVDLQKFDNKNHDDIGNF